MRPYKDKKKVWSELEFGVLKIFGRQKTEDRRPKLKLEAVWNRIPPLKGVRGMFLDLDPLLGGVRGGFLLYFLSLKYSFVIGFKPPLADCKQLAFQKPFP